MNRDRKMRNKGTAYTYQEKECVCSWGLIYYFNVRFYFALRDDSDKDKFSYLTRRVEEGEQLCMRDIYTWCYRQGIEVRPQFQYLKRLPLTANIWNFYSYLRGRYEYTYKICKGEKVDK